MLGIVFLLVTSVVGAGDEGDGAKYTCPMHPHYIADEMGSCPICGMDLVKM
ncbi:MAG: heavy metal-binding domain-containing protein, partial [Candidatus Thiodiazotropha sp.]